MVYLKLSTVNNKVTSVQLALSALACKTSVISLINEKLKHIFCKYQLILSSVVGVWCLFYRKIHV